MPLKCANIPEPCMHLKQKFSTFYGEAMLGKQTKHFGYYYQNLNFKDVKMTYTLAGMNIWWIIIPQEDMYALSFLSNVFCLQ